MNKEAEILRSQKIEVFLFIPIDFPEEYTEYMGVCRDFSLLLRMTLILWMGLNLIDFNMEF